MSGGESGSRELIHEAAAEAAAAGVRLTVLNGIVGAAGLRATMATLHAGAELALANKESMVAGGPFVLAAARASGSLILPVDSEHSALFQCLAAGGPQAPVDELLLTGSGGPFRGRQAADLAAVTPEQALKHPNWSMGPKITVDSATLMNKGLEVIEAHYLFGLPYERITVLLNPQSVVHSMVRFGDGAILAHLGAPDMRTPIGYALAYPQRPPLPMVRRLDVLAAGLSFEAPDTETFRCLALAQAAGRQAAAAEQQAAAAGQRAAHRGRAHRAQRRQRGRGGGLPGRSPGLHGDRRGRREVSHLAGRRACRPTWTTCTPPTPRRGASRPRPWPARPPSLYAASPARNTSFMRRG